MRTRLEMLWLFVLCGCTLVVGSDPRVDEDAAVTNDAADEPASNVKDAAPKEEKDVSAPTDAAADHACDAAGCNATKDACKKTCADTAKKCNDACTAEDGKSCHDLCNQQLQACNNACWMTCLQCVTGCGTCGP